jgi:hypothetical protein
MVAFVHGEVTRGPWETPSDALPSEMSFQI